jgi:F0F1-type ATP synthase assembly protein I
MSADELRRLVERARGETAAQVTTAADAAKAQAEAEARYWAALDAHEAEQREIRALQADARARCGAGNIAFGRAAATVGGSTLVGYLLGGPIGGLVGAGLGWMFDHMRGAR